MKESTEIHILSHNIAWLRKTHGLSKRKMAQIMGIGVGTLNALEGGSLPPRLGVSALYAIYDYFGIKPSVFLIQKLGEQNTPD